MSNKEFFDWMYERLIYVYKEGSNVDFVQSFKKRTDWLIQNTIGWISVKDRLPEKDGFYLTCVNQAGVAQCVGLQYFDTNLMKWRDFDEEVREVFIDYWMEIPKLPKEEEK